MRKSREVLDWKIKEQEISVVLYLIFLYTPDRTRNQSAKQELTNNLFPLSFFQRTERFQHSVVISGKKRQWKALKQILAQEVCETTTKESTTSTTSSNSELKNSF